MVLVGLAAAWLLLFVDAWRLGRPDLLPRRDRRTLLVTLVVAALVLCGGTAWAGRTVGEARSAMSSLFASGEALAASNGRYNVLLLGGDSGAGRVGLRPDSIQLASIDAETGRAVLFGFSRETELITFQPGSTMARLMPEGWTCGDECLLNGLYTWAQEHADQFPPGTTDPGVVATTEAVESLTDLDVQYHVLVDLKGFSSLVDAVGGLDIAVQRRTPIGGGASPIRGWIEPGVQHLDGYHALWYARSRTKSTNYERMARQRCVVTALVRQLDPQTIVLNMGDILAATTGVFRTTSPRRRWPALADVAVRTKQQKITSVNFVPPLIDPWDYDPEVVRSTVDRAIAGPRKRRTRALRRRTRPHPATPPPRLRPPPRRPGRPRSRPSWSAPAPTPTPTPATSPASAPWADAVGSVGAGRTFVQHVGARGGDLAPGGGVRDPLNPGELRARTPLAPEERPATGQGVGDTAVEGRGHTRPGRSPPGRGGGRAAAVPVWCWSSPVGQSMRVPPTTYM